ncbi:MAG: hypothetical protein ACRDL7_06590, partial [Gaiellaceae bacterium]
LEGALAAAERYFDHESAASRYQSRAVLAARVRALLSRGQAEDALVDAERALAVLREAGHDAQVAAHVLTTTSRCFRAAGRVEEADALLAETPLDDELTHDLPLYLVELGRGDEYLEANAGIPGHLWQAAGRSAASGDFVGASEIYSRIGARFEEAWAALLAAEHGDASRLEAALAYFEEQRATPYVQRCRALLQASA